jgi:hypothetical protein
VRSAADGDLLLADVLAWHAVQHDRWLTCYRQAGTLDGEIRERCLELSYQRIGNLHMVGDIAPGIVVAEASCSVKTLSTSGILAFSAIICLLLPTAAWPAADRPTAVDFCPPLPPPTGDTVTVDTVESLQGAVNGAVPDQTILVADGIYDLDGAYLRFDVPGVTLRSISGDRQSVVLDGNYVTTEIVQIVASEVTIADLTLREAYYHPIHVTSTAGADTTGTRIYNVHIVDPGQ